jgi:nucleoside-diphosphate-sugar epimerase
VIYGSVKRGNIFRMMTAIDRGRFPAIPEFHNRRSMIHRDDAVRALIQSACSEKTSGRVFVVTDGESYSSRRIYLSIRAALGKAPSSLYIPVLILRAAARAGDAYARVFKRPFPINTALLDKISGSAEYDGSAFAEEIGFQACYNLESALPTMVSQYRQGSGD